MSMGGNRSNMSTGNISNINRRFWLGLAALLIWLLPVQVCAQDVDFGNADFRIYAEADGSAYQVGDTVEITLWLECADVNDAGEVSWLYNFEDWLIYDRDMLEFTGCGALAEGFRLADRLAYNAEYDRLAVRYQVTTPGAEAMSVQPALRVAELSFRALQTGQTTLFHDAAAVWVQAEGDTGVTVTAPRTVLLINGAAQPPNGGGSAGNAGSAGSGGGAGSVGSGGVVQEVTDGAAAGECSGGADCPTAAMGDLQAGAWYHRAIDYMLDGGLMNGITADSFAPGLALDRGMLATILWRAAGEPQAAAAAPFADVPGSLYCAEAVGWAYDEGAVLGIGNGLFAPGAPVRREQMAAILWRLQGEPEVGGALDGFLEGFVDGGDVAGYAVPALCWAVEKGLLLGDDQMRLRPTDSITRAEAAALLMRYLELERT